MGRVHKRLESWWVRKTWERAAGWGGSRAACRLCPGHGQERRAQPRATAKGKTAPVALGRSKERKESRSAAAPLRMPCDPAGASSPVSILWSQLPPPLGGSESPTESIFSVPVSVSCALRFRESLG